MNMRRYLAAINSAAKDGELAEINFRVGVQLATDGIATILDDPCDVALAEQLKEMLKLIDDFNPL